MLYKGLGFTAHNDADMFSQPHTHRMQPLDRVDLRTTPGARGLAWTMAAMVAFMGTHRIRVRDAGGNNWGYLGVSRRRSIPSLKIIDAGGFMLDQQNTSWPSKKYLKGFNWMMMQAGIHAELDAITRNRGDCAAVLAEVLVKLANLKGADAVWWGYVQQIKIA